MAGFFSIFGLMLGQGVARQDPQHHGEGSLLAGPHESLFYVGAVTGFVTTFCGLIWLARRIAGPFFDSL